MDGSNKGGGELNICWSGAAIANAGDSVVRVVVIPSVDCLGFPILQLTGLILRLSAGSNRKSTARSCS